MRLVKRIKRDTLIVMISVIILSLATMRVAYSAVFSVKSQSTVQEITSGTLNVIINNELSEQMNIEELFPTSEKSLPTAEDSSVDGTYATLVLNNSGTLDAEFSVTIGYDNLPAGKTYEDLISFDYLMIGIYDVNNDKWVKYGSSYYTQISNLTPSETNVYPILRDTIIAPDGSGKTVGQYKIYIWLKEDTPTTEIGKLAYLKINVKSTTVNGGIES